MQLYTFPVTHWPEVWWLDSFQRPQRLSRTLRSDTSGRHAASVVLWLSCNTWICQFVDIGSTNYIDRHDRRNLHNCKIATGSYKLPDLPSWFTSLCLPHLRLIYSSSSLSEALWKDPRRIVEELTVPQVETCREASWNPASCHNTSSKLPAELWRIMQPSWAPFCLRVLQKKAIGFPVSLRASTRGDAAPWVYR